MSQSDRRDNNSDPFRVSTERRRFLEEKKEVRPKVTKRTDLFETRSVVMKEIDTVLIQKLIGKRTVLLDTFAALHRYTPHRTSHMQVFGGFIRSVYEMT